MTVVKEHDFNNPDIHEKYYALHDIIKNCRIWYFHTFEYTLVYDNKYTKFLIMKKSISQLPINLWNLKLNSMIWINTFILVIIYMYTYNNMCSHTFIEIMRYE